MSRKKFIESQGATCRNWTWSWSFINEEKKVIIFGAWDTNTDGDTSLILSDTWQVSGRGRKQPAYEQSREHIRLIEEEGYELQTFPLIYSDANKDEEGIGPAKIEGFVPELSKKLLKKVGGKWYASDGEMSNQLPEEVGSPEEYVEGASKTVSVNTYERSADARAKCIAHHGYSCAVCGFNFEQVYGAIGEKYIHVHHIIPLAEIRKEYVLNPIKDLVPVCANCHGIIHRTRPALTVEQLKEHLSNK
ncbi:MAG TPA: HNH endonuclease [Methylophaga aminisulfidivorans]|uniref:HNH endonuclease n=1 Tax=Methylophaga aminisulfidivorans TaxID=230105 RepID=A0A7C1ZVA7_9GAMM|nr:HNH endonuclease [Methylophaga aminisulfidivorans]